MGNVHFGSKTSPFYQENIEFPFFNYYLKGKGDTKLPEAYVFETGKNVWHKHDAWPPKNAQPASIYLHAGGKLSFDAPGDESFDEYVSDPDKPVPYIAEQASGMTREHMTEDQRFAASRPDVLVYQTDALDHEYHCWSVEAEFVRFYFGNGFGFCGQADRCLSGRLSG